MNIPGIPAGAEVRPISNTNVTGVPAGAEVKPIEAPDVSESTSLPDSLPAPKIPSSINEDNAIENSPAFRKSLQDAWEKSGSGQQRMTEGAFFVDDSGKESPVQVHAGGETGGSVKMQVPTDAPIVAHTHDYFAQGEGPSPQDVQTAKDQKHQIITATRDGLYETDTTGKTSRVMKNLDWLGKKPAGKSKK